MQLTFAHKVVLTLIMFGIALVGFMVKLPSVFRHMDKELHTVFYFLAAAFLNVLFAGTNFFKHVGIFIFLFLFGLGIEYVQQYSRKYFPSFRHGRFDPEDVHANLMGLVAFTIVWIVIVLGILVFGKTGNDKSVRNNIG